MKRNSTIILVLLLGVVASFRSQDRPKASQVSEDLLGHSVTNLSPSPQSVEIGFQATLLGSGVPGGEVLIQGCVGQSVSLVGLTGVTLRDVLEHIVEADPQYRWELHRGAVNLLPVGGVPSLLKVKLKVFDSGDATDISSAGTYLFGMPEIREAAKRLGIIRNGLGTGLYALVPGQSPPRKRLDIHLRDTTVLEALNAIVCANHRGVWTYREMRCNAPLAFDLSFSQ